MPDLLVKSVSDADKKKLRLQAARHGHSMQEELRTIIHNGVNPSGGQSFYEALKEAFDGLEDEGFTLPERRAPRHAPSFE